MPVDYEDSGSLDNFIEQLRYLDGVMASVEFDSCICAGDFNVDSNKEKQGCFSRALCAFMRDHELHKADSADEWSVYLEFWRQ